MYRRDGKNGDQGWRYKEVCSAEKGTFQNCVRVKELRSSYDMRERSRLSFALKSDRSEAMFRVLSLYCLTNLKIKQFNLCKKTITIGK